MSLIVVKFGGSSVADKDRVFNVAKRITEIHDAGNRVIAVVSAQGDTTDHLIQKAKEINNNPSKRELDVLLSCGEQMSMSLLCMAIEKLGYPCISLTGWQIGFRTNSRYGSAHIKNIDTERLQMEIDRRNIVVVAGFQGVNKMEDITTLGRGGSDTSAVAIAAAMHADLCQIYTDVEGVYTADPRIVKNAVKLSDISYDEMLELASLGANVLHNRSVELAKKFGVKLEVLSSLVKKCGTTVKEVGKVEKMSVRGVTRDKDVARISLINIDDKPGKAFRIFSVLAKKNINVDVILQSIGREDKKDITFTVPESCLEEALNAINENMSDIGAERIVSKSEVAKVSVVGAGMASNPGIAAKMFEALFDANINIHMISTSEIKVSVIIDEKEAEKAVNVIHDKFQLEQGVN